MKKLLFGISMMSLLFYGCSKDNDDNSAINNEDILAPNGVSALKAEESDGKVTLTWTNPSDIEITKIVVIHNDTEIEVDKGQTSYVIEGLTNFSEYKLEVMIVDNNGNRSKAESIIATPKIPFQIVDAGLPQIGRYKEVDGEKAFIFEKGNNVQLYNPSDLKNYKLNASLIYRNSGEVIIDGTYSTYAFENKISNVNIISFNTDVYNSALCVTLKSGTYIGFGLLEKISGPEGELEGKYAGYKHSTGELPNSEGSIEIEFTVSKNGSWENKYLKYSDQLNIQNNIVLNKTGSFTENDIRNRKYYLLKYNNRYFLNISVEFYKKVEEK